MKRGGLAIVAYGPSVFRFFPKRDQFREVWSINGAYAHYGFKADLIIAADDMRVARDFHKLLPAEVKHVKDCAESGVPCLSAAEYPEWKSVKAYPLEEVARGLRLDDEWKPRVMSNSCCFALALAIHRKFKSVSVYGFEFCDADDPKTLIEASRQMAPHVPWWHAYHQKSVVRRPGEPGLDGVCFLLGVAHARGIKVELPNSTILDFDRPKFVYGYKEPSLESLMEDGAGDTKENQAQT